MALKPRIANVPMVEKNGYCVNGLLEAIEQIEEGESEFGRAGFKFMFGCDGSQKRIVLSVFTGDAVNFEKYASTAKGKEDFNKLTKICLKMGLFTVEELKSSEAFPELDPMIGRKVRFKLTKKKFLNQIDLDTLEVVDQ